MKVLIIGASGFVGLPVAHALLKAGHIVYGQTRSKAKAKQLAAEEIIPLVGEPTDISLYEPIIGTLDAVVEALAGGDLKATSLSLLSSVADATIRLRPEGAPKLVYVYTSGTWVHGENRTDIVCDTTPLTAPAQLVAWRPAVEQTVVKHETVNGVVIRPSLVYGRSASLLAIMFRNAYEGQVKWFGTPGGRLSLIHQDDLADLYRRVIENGQIVRGLTFIASNDCNESTDGVMQKLAELSGSKKPVEYVEPSNLFEAAIACTAIIRPYLGRALLGWQPRKPGLSDNLGVYYNAWKASVGLE